MPIEAMKIAVERYAKSLFEHYKTCNTFVLGGKAYDDILQLYESTLITQVLPAEKQNVGKEKTMNAQEEGISITALAAVINMLTNTCHQQAASAGWWRDDETGEDVRNWHPKFFRLWVATKLMLTVSEISEAMEGHRKDLMDDKLPHRKALEVELADAAIRISDLAGGLGLDLGGAITEKLIYNANREDHKIENRKKENGKKY